MIKQLNANGSYISRTKSEDYVIGTGESHSVREFVELGFQYAGIQLEWRENGVKEQGIIASVNTKLNEVGFKKGTSLQNPCSSIKLKMGDVLIVIDSRYFRPTEVDFLLADFSKSKKQLGWKPKVTFGDLVKIMFDADIEAVNIVPPGEGGKILLTKGIHWTAWYIDPEDVDSIAEGISRVVTDSMLQSSLNQKGLEQAKLFSWERSAQEHIKVFEDILKS